MTQPERARGLRQEPERSTADTAASRAQPSAADHPAAPGAARIEITVIRVQRTWPAGADRAEALETVAPGRRPSIGHLSWPRRVAHWFSTLKRRGPKTAAPR